MPNPDRTKARNIKDVLEKLPAVASVDNVTIKDKVIDYISIGSQSWGKLTIQRLGVSDAPRLFDFYFNGLSQKSRDLFSPYPLFSPPVSSAEELASRITEWEKEDDWTVFTLIGQEQIIGISLLKRYKTERPTSGLAVREEYQKKGMGLLLQTVANEQARLLNLKTLYATVASDNVTSLQLHLKCGFKQTGKLVPHYGYKNGIKEVDRHDIEMVIEFNHG